jgi:hypothetical protein
MNSEEDLVWKEYQSSRRWLAASVAGLAYGIFCFYWSTEHCSRSAFAGEFGLLIILTAPGGFVLGVASIFWGWISFGVRRESYRRWCEINETKRSSKY